MAAQQQDFINRLEEIEKEISMSLWPKEETTQNPKFLPKTTREVYFVPVFLSFVSD